MRTLRPQAVLLVLLVGGVALASTFVIQPMVEWFKRGIYVGATATASSAHLLTETLSTADITHDHAETDGGTCLVSPATTVTGAAVGDPCVIAPNATASTLHGTWSCHVSAANAVRIKLCAGADNLDPASGAFRVRTFSNQ